METWYVHVLYQNVGFSETFSEEVDLVIENFSFILTQLVSPREKQMSMSHKLTDLL